jgi:uncharacterized protein
MMLLVISPAKTLDYDNPPPLSEFTQPRHIDDAQLLIDALRDYTPAAIARLMGLSDKLAALNVARYESWSKHFDESNAKQALFAFKGDVYTGLSADDFTKADTAFAQRHLRMLSGLYGLLRPLDLMQPYRLEMGTRLPNTRGKDLYAFWGERITQWLNDDLKAQGDDVLINLASNEYFHSVKPKALAGRIIDVEFRDRKGDDYKIISFHAKKARGLMARYVIKHRIDQIDALRAFDSNGYHYDDERSTPNKLVFLRDPQ